MIISASRRTDIPAFYSDWFMNRVEQGFLLTRNPFNYNQISRVSLKPSDVDAIVFWTRNARRIMPSLNVLDSKGMQYYFQYTVTGYPRLIERSVPQPREAIRTFIELSVRLGAGRVIWRYDPILLSNLVSIHEHKRLFSKIAGMLAGYTDLVVVSFADFYEKTNKNLAKVPGLIFSDVLAQQNELLDLVDFMVRTASDNGMKIESCAEEIDMSALGIPHGKCIDDQRLRKLFNIASRQIKDPGQRLACGCVKSIDIGMYNTCLHGCSYCYATFDHDKTLAQRKQHDPMSPFLIGGVEGVPEHLLYVDPPQGSLF
ncbi:DUF1848 domain-containing protein [Pseudomonas sp. PA27(2017)]|uniref:DUF1848 domain-containing protein n=1 Tax=Pseudomonas sp. PA27(2017) TaxID=1932112 RepID=UPI00096996C9|nr:DUF1848 domain-containing protein [Pseudomonas sp. PA27(2017)]OLU35347.1 hypothetical protein BVH06_03035 [Pseudomonas sp. PA27(2017)]